MGVGEGERGREGPAQQTGERGREGPAMNIDILMKAAGGGRGGEREEGGVKGVFRETNRTGQKNGATKTGENSVFCTVENGTACASLPFNQSECKSKSTAKPVKERLESESKACTVLSAFICDAAWLFLSGVGIWGNGGVWIKEVEGGKRGEIYGLGK